MRVTVLGKSPAWQDAGGACSGYLVEDGEQCVLTDCGNGVFSKLRRVRDYTRTSAVVISHMHADHFFDLIPYAFALVYAPRQQTVPVARWPGVENPPRPQLYLPPGGRKMLADVTAAIGAPELVEQAFEIAEYDPDGVLKLGPLSVTFQAVPHYVPTWAIKYVSPESSAGSFVYGADHKPNDEIVEFAQQADLLLMEATLPRPERSGERGHMTPEESGEHAARAGAKRLVLTHISDELDHLWAKTEAEAAFNGPVAVAAEGAVHAV
jgi:ribonuclease BN (tRNA processing enzyme)